MLTMMYKYFSKNDQESTHSSYPNGRKESGVYFFAYGIYDLGHLCCFRVLWMTGGFTSVHGEEQRVLNSVS